MFTCLLQQPDMQLRFDCAERCNKSSSTSPVEFSNVSADTSDSRWLVRLNSSAYVYTF